MTRRLLLMVPLAAVVDSPRNRLCIAGNVFDGQYAKWATAMNAKRDTLDVNAVEAFEPLPGLWRKVEDLWRAWLKG